MTAKTVQLPASLYLGAGLDSTPGIYTWVNENAQAGDTVVWPVGTVELHSTLWNLGRSFVTANVFDVAASPTVVQPNDTSAGIFGFRAEHDNDGVYHGAKLHGFRVRGSNDPWGRYTTATYGQNGVTIDASRPYSYLCDVTLCDIGNVQGDGVYGGGTVLACELHHVGRHGRTMHFHGAKLLWSRVHHTARHVYALESAHTAFGVEISDNTFGGKSGYVSCACTPGTADGVTYDYGFKFLRNHSTQADLAAGSIDQLIDIVWTDRFGMDIDGITRSREVWIADNKFLEVALDGNKAVLDALDPHYQQGMTTPGLTVMHTDGLHVLRNEHLCRGPFLAAPGCTAVEVAGNVGGPHMTGQTA